MSNEAEYEPLRPPNVPPAPKWLNTAIFFVCASVVFAGNNAAAVAFLPLPLLALSLSAAACACTR